MKTNTQVTIEAESLVGSPAFCRVFAILLGVITYIIIDIAGVGPVSIVMILIACFSLYRGQVNQKKLNKLLVDIQVD